MSDTEVLDLNEISMTGEGVEAVAGLTGFGLPPVSVQWLEGAGNGATFRNSRALPRDVDIPLEIYKPNRADLRNVVNKLSRIVQGRMTLNVYDSENASYYHTAEVYRTGGGSYAYGTDTDGFHTWTGVLTLRAGSPFFERSNLMTVSRPYVAGLTTEHTIILDNEGSAPTPPTIALNSNVTSFKITKGNEVLEWSNPGGSPGIIISMGDGRVTAQSDPNVSLYGGVHSFPKFFSLEPGSNTVTIKATYATARTAGGAAMTISFTPRDWMVI